MVLLEISLYCMAFKKCECFLKTRLKDYSEFRTILNDFPSVWLHKLYFSRTGCWASWLSMITKRISAKNQRALTKREKTEDLQY